MKVLMISGDGRMLKPGTEAHARYLLQKAQVEELAVVVWGLYSPLAFLYAIVLSLSRSFDVVTAQDPFWRGLLGLICARLGGARLQVQVHGDLGAIASSQEKSFRRRLAELVFRHADSVRAVSEKTKAQAEALGAECYVDILPVFIDLEKMRRAPVADLKKAFPQFGKILLFAGRFELEKAPTEALRVFRDVAKEFPGAGFLMAGEGSERKNLEALARNLGLSEKVIFLGYRVDLPSLYKSVDCLLVTSPYESYGAALVEALAAGCPVVAPDVGVAAEAGAMIKERHELAQGVIDVFRSGGRGVLRLQVLGREEWASRWRETLQ